MTTVELKEIIQATLKPNETILNISFYQFKKAVAIVIIIARDFSCFDSKIHVYDFDNIDKAITFFNEKPFYEPDFNGNEVTSNIDGKYILENLK